MKPAPEFVKFVQKYGLGRSDEDGEWEPLAGGVSSDIWHVATSTGDYCVKRALAQLKVAAIWQAPVERNAYEWAYLILADRILPGSVPTPIAHDAEHGLFAMAWLAPGTHRLWKSELLCGRVDLAVARGVGNLVGRIHAATARNSQVARDFATDQSFHELRIDPYLLATAAAHPDLAPELNRIAETTAGTKLALVHGDVSPKNILVGSEGPILLDAECAWFGDPAFDLAFCLNHLIIKARVVASARDQLQEAFDSLAASYFVHVDWEPRDALERRAASLLPALALARVDGKSPVEYLGVADRSALRSAARAAVAARCTTLADARAMLLSRP